MFGIRKAKLLSDSILFLMLFFSVSGCDQKKSILQEKKIKSIDSSSAVKTPMKKQDVNPLSVSDAFMYLPPPGASQGVIYMSAKNNLARSLVVNYIDASIADRIEIHNTVHEEGLMKMRQINHFSFPVDQQILFEPGGYHLMVYDMVDNIANVDGFVMRIEFEGAAPIDVDVSIRKRK